MSEFRHTPEGAQNFSQRSKLAENSSIPSEKSTKKPETSSINTKTERGMAKSKQEQGAEIRAFEDYLRKCNMILANSYASEVDRLNVLIHIGEKASNFLADYGDMSAGKAVRQALDTIFGVGNLKPQLIPREKLKEPFGIYTDQLLTPEEEERLAAMSVSNK